MGLFRKKQQKQIPAPQKEQTTSGSKEFYDMDDIVKSFQTDTKMLINPPIPETLNGKPIKYEYHDVRLEPAGVYRQNGVINIEQPLALVEKGERVEVYNNGTYIGMLPNNRLSGMVHDWNTKYNALYIAYIASYSIDGTDILIHLVFYDYK